MQLSLIPLQVVHSLRPFPPGPGSVFHYLRSGGCHPQCQRILWMFWVSWRTCGLLQGGKEEALVSCGSHLGEVLPSKTHLMLDKTSEALKYIVLAVLYTFSLLQHTCLPPSSLMPASSPPAPLHPFPPAQQPRCGFCGQCVLLHAFLVSVCVPLAALCHSIPLTYPLKLQQRSDPHP